MEYLVGAIFAIALLGLYNYFINVKHSSDPIKIRYRQSHIFNLIAPAIPILQSMEAEERPSQSREHSQGKSLRVIFTDNKAYWIKENNFYVANVVNGMIDEDSKQIVDTMAMDKVELDKMIFIVEKLREGTDNDRGNPGNKKF